jgi:hypothetical protein
VGATSPSATSVAEAEPHAESQESDSGEGGESENYDPPLPIIHVFLRADGSAIVLDDPVWTSRGRFL